MTQEELEHQLAGLCLMALVDVTVKTAIVASLAALRVTMPLDLERKAARPEIKHDIRSGQHAVKELFCDKGCCGAAELFKADEPAPSVKSDDGVFVAHEPKKRRRK